MHHCLFLFFDLMDVVKNFYVITIGWEKSKLLETFLELSLVIKDSGERLLSLKAKAVYLVIILISLILWLLRNIKDVL